MSETKKAEDKVSSVDFRGTLYASFVLALKATVYEAVANNIKSADLCTDEAVTKGTPLPTDAHITVKLGLDPKTTEDQLREALAMVSPFELKIGQVLGCFHNSGKFDDGKLHERDVLWASVSYNKALGGLSALRARLAEFALPEKSDEREGGYKPHVTLAFLEYGKGEAYTTNKPLLEALAGQRILVDRVTFKVLGDKSFKPFEIGL